MYDPLPPESDIIAALAAHGATNHCPRCGADKWQVGIGRCNIFYARHAPIPVYCLQCGFVAMHAPEELGLLRDATPIEARGLLEKSKGWMRTLIGAWTNRCEGAGKHVN